LVFTGPVRHTWLVIVVIVVANLGIMLTWVNRKPGELRSTGRTLSPAMEGEAGGRSFGMRSSHRGGCNGPAPWGRFRVSAPFAGLEIGPHEVRLRGAPVAIVSGGSVGWSPADLRRVFAARGRWNRLVEGVGFEDLQGRRWYFWVTGTPVATVLTELQEAGYSVTWEEQEVRL
jgi:hypothetical protein